MSPRTVRSISDRPIDQEWVKALSELDTLSSTINADTSTPENIKAIEDVRPLLKNLQEKVRYFYRPVIAHSGRITNLI